jgi:hypothetical protein
VTRRASGSLELLLLKEHGPILTAPETAKLLGYRSTEALKRARLRGILPVEMFAIPNRRGWFSSTQAVAAWVEDTVNTHVDQKGREVPVSE